jgi:chitin synthase
VSGSYRPLFAFANIAADASQTHWVNIAFTWVYLTFLMLQASVRPGGNRRNVDDMTVCAGSGEPTERGKGLVSADALVSSHADQQLNVVRVYAVLSLYLIVCSVLLSVVAFKVCMTTTYFESY